MFFVFFFQKIFFSIYCHCEFSYYSQVCLEHVSGGEEKTETAY